VEAFRKTGVHRQTSPAVQLPKQATTPGVGSSLLPGGMPRRISWSAAGLEVWCPCLPEPTFSQLLEPETAQLYIEHRLVTTMMRADFGQTVQGTISLKAGRPVPVELKYSNSSAIMGPAWRWVGSLRSRHAGQGCSCGQAQSDMAIVSRQNKWAKAGQVTLSLPEIRTTLSQR